MNAADSFSSPFITEEGEGIVVVLTENDGRLLVPVTIRNGNPLDYKKGLWGKGRQLEVDAEDFPALAETGLHSETELVRTKMITGRSVGEITELGRPGKLSFAGFIAADEDILSVLRGDNRLVGKLGSTHFQMARLLYHVWNMILRDYELKRFGRFWESIILYNGKKIHLKAEGSKGWQKPPRDRSLLPRKTLRGARFASS